MAGKKTTSSADLDDELEEALPRRVEFVVTQPEPSAALGEIQAGIGRLEQRIGELMNVLTATVTAQKPHAQNPAPAAAVTEPTPPIQPVQIVQPVQPAAPAPAAKPATSLTVDADLVEEVCPACGERFLVTGNVWGVHCPNCGATLRVDLDDAASEDDIYDFPAARDVPKGESKEAAKSDAKKRQSNPGLLGVFTDFDRRYAQLLDG